MWAHEYASANAGTVVSGNERRRVPHSTVIARTDARLASCFAVGMTPTLRAACAVCVGLTCATAPGLASAQQASEPVEKQPAPETRTTWYGAPMLAMDAASVGLLVAGSGLVVNNMTFCPLGCPSDPGRTQAENGGVSMLLAGGAGFLLAAPIDHALHGRGETAAKSFLVRLFLPPAALLSGLGLASVACGGDQGCEAAIPLGLLGTSVVGTIIVDDIVSARQTVPAETSTVWRHVVPTLSVGRSTAIGFAAEF